ncbi:hypothetical protein KBB27_01075 [Patescibacteria group bacterium]|nr:hypothetical protein [Patescibacteria group bacterium]
MNTELRAKPPDVLSTTVYGVVAVGVFLLANKAWSIFDRLIPTFRMDPIGLAIELVDLFITIIIGIGMILLAWGAMHRSLCLENEEIQTRVQLLSRPLWSTSLKPFDRLTIVRSTAIFYTTLRWSTEYRLSFSRSDAPSITKTILLPLGRTDTDPETLAFAESIRNEMAKVNQHT